MQSKEGGLLCLNVVLLGGGKKRGEDACGRRESYSVGSGFSIFSVV